MTETTPTRKKKPELLCPAGNFEKLKAAVLYGADAVYLSYSEFGMRSAADNFTLDEITEAVRHCHDRNVKVYVTVNTMPHWDEYAALEQYMTDLSTTGIDAVIVADLGVAALVREIMPSSIHLHISTQAGAVSHAECNAWHRLGANRVVLARELNFADIAEIKKRIPPELELEAFIHGSMCVSYSGRCLLSNHFTGRDANRGKCTQPCRWNYKLYEIEEEKRPDQRMPIIETDRGTFIMSSRDMCMIEHIPLLMESPIVSFKIEGRMKSAYYAAVTANSYRMAIDSYLSGHYNYDPLWKKELESVSHRLYCSGYYLDEVTENAQICTETGYIREKAYIATAIFYDSQTGRAVFLQKNKISEGDNAELISPGKTGRAFVAASLCDEQGNTIPSAPHPEMIFSMQMPFAVTPGDIVRLG